MYLFKRFLPIICSSAMALSMISLVLRPDRIFELSVIQYLPYITLAITLLTMSIAIYSMFSIGAGHPLAERMRFSIYPLTCYLSTLTLVSFFDVIWLVWIISILSALSVWVWMETLYNYWQHRELYQPYSLQRLSNYLYIYLIFLFVASLIGLYIFLQLSLTIVFALVFVGVMYIQYDLLRLNGVEKRISAVFTSIGSLFVMQLLVVMAMLPTHYFLFGGAISLFMYSWLGVGIQTLLKQKNTVQKSLYISIASLGCIVLLLGTYFV